MATWKKVVVESSSNTIAQNTSGNSATVTTNANLTGNVTSSGNATTIANGVITKSKLSVGGTDADYKYLASVSGGTGLSWESIPVATDTIADGNSNPATSNGVFDAIAALSDANTTYTTSVVNDAPDVKIRLTGSDSSTDDVKLMGSGGAGDGGLTYSVSGSNITPSVGDNAISADQLQVANDGSAGQLLKSDGDGSFSWVNQTSVDASISSSSSNPVENHVVYDQLALKANLAGNTSQAFSTANLVVMGNLTVSGSTTTVNTEEINLADNVIVFNSNLLANEAPTQDSGITVNRGNTTDQSFYWDETNHAWAIGHTESGNSFTKTGYVAMANAQTYSSTQDNVNGFGEVGHFQIDGDNVYIRTA
jgi:hypothetical protein